MLEGYTDAKVMRPTTMLVLNSFTLNECQRANQVMIVRSPM